MPRLDGHSFTHKQNQVSQLLLSSRWNALLLLVMCFTLYVKLLKLVQAVCLIALCYVWIFARADFFEGNWKWSTWQMLLRLFSNVCFHSFFLKAQNFGFFFCKAVDLDFILIFLTINLFTGRLDSNICLKWRAYENKSIITC